MFVHDVERRSAAALSICRFEQRCGFVKLVLWKQQLVLPETQVTRYSGHMGDTLSLKAQGRAAAILSAEMALRERSAGSGLQVSLEARGVRLVRELDDDMRVPGTVLRRMRAVSLIVPG